MTAPSFGTYGEQGDFATDGQLEDALNGLSLGDDAKPAQPGTVDDTAPIPQGGALLEQPDQKKLFKAIDGTVLRQERVARNREERAKHWDRVRGGTPFAYLEKNEDRSIYKATLAPGVDDVGGQPVPNKMDDLCNKIICQILVDDFLPNPKPDGDDDRDRGAADLTKKFLRGDGTATGTDDKQLLRDALNMNITAASSFAMCWVDKAGGGWRPKQINAHPRATDAANPLYAPRLGDDGQPVQTATGPIMEKTSSPVMRYVAEIPNPQDPKAPPTLTFTENAAEAARQWLPKHMSRKLSVNQVRTVPLSADVFHADAVILLMYDSLGEAKKRFAVLDTLKPEQLKAVCTWRPRRWKAVVPESHRPKDSEGGGEVTDDTLIMWYEHYCRISPRYPDGAQVCVNGSNGGFVLLRDTLREDVELDEGETVPVLMDPPVTQFMATSDTVDCDAFGLAPISRFGGGKEAWDHIWTGLFDAMHKTLNPNVYIGAMSGVSKEDQNRRDGTPIDIMTKDDIPTFETPPVIPVFLPEMLDKIETSLNSAAGTNETSNGLDSSYSQSGVAKDIAIKQARVALAQYWQNTVKGITHWWKIKAQQAQARLTVPQVVKLSGADSAYKQPWFVGSDLCGVSEIALEPGTGTMMSPSEKTQWLQVMQQNQWMDAEQAGENARSSMSDDLGIQPNIHEEAVNREIAEWSKGPPPGWEQQAQAYQQQGQQAQQAIQARVQQLVATGIDQQTATQQAQSEIPMPPAPPSPFEQRPNTSEQLIAIIRHNRLSRMQSTVEYTKQAGPWRVLYDAEYQRMRQAAGIATIAEQQQAAQQQAQQAADDAQYQGFLQKIDETARRLAEGEIAKGVGAEMGGGGAGAAPADPAAEAERERAFKAQQADADRQTTLETDARKHMTTEGIAAARQAGRPTSRGATRAPASPPAGG